MFDDDLLIINNTQETKTMLFNIDKNCIKNGKLVDSIGGIADEGLTTLPSVVDDYLYFSGNDYFSFNVAGLDLYNKDFTILLDYYMEQTNSIAGLFSISASVTNWNSRLFYLYNKDTSTLGLDIQGGFTSVSVGKEYSLKLSWSSSELETSLTYTRNVLKLCFSRESGIFKLYINDKLLQDCVYVPSKTDYSCLSNANSSKFKGRIYQFTIYEGIL